MDFKFKRTRIDKIPESKILDELEQAAKHFKYIEFGWRDFDKVASISAGTVENHFGNWKKGLKALKKHLQSKGKDLSPRPVPPNRTYSDKEMFEEMERIWGEAGQRPSRNEWEMFNPKINYGTYTHRFGGWIKACYKFIEYKMGEEISSDDFIIEDTKDMPKSIKEKHVKVNTRNVTLSLRLKILNRDNFRCVFCGKSPATDFGTKLHIDHIVPFSKGGKSVFENLQTLCEECNLGKSDKKISLPE